MGEMEMNDVQENAEQTEPAGQTEILKEYLEKAGRDHDEIKEGVRYLQDLFVRRLNEDKQKSELIKHLQDLSVFAVIEPFISDMILILDRIYGTEDDFARSVGEELYDALNRRGLERIEASGRFDPARHKAVRMVEDDSVDELTIVQVIRNGYVFGSKVIRPAEVVVARSADQKQN